MKPITSLPFGAPPPRYVNRDAIRGVVRGGRAVAKAKVAVGIGYRQLRCDGLPALSLADGTCPAAGMPVRVLRSNGKTYQLLGQLGIGSSGSGSGSVLSVGGPVIAPTPSGHLLYVGTDEDTSGVLGVYWSGDRAATWTGRPSVDGPGGSVTALMVAAGEVYAGVGVDGIYRGSSAGWVHLVGPVGETVTCLASDPTNPALLFAGTAGGGIYLSTDRGATWAASNTGLSFANIRSLSVAPDGTIYAGRNGGGLTDWAAVSTTSGTSWVTLTPTDALDFGPRVLVASDPHTPGFVWFGANHPSGGGSAGALVQSLDGGAVGSVVDPPNGQIWAIVFDPTTATVMYAGAFGDVWQSVSGAWSDVYSFADVGPINALLVEPTEAATIYAGHVSQGVAVSRDGAASWALSHTGLDGAHGGLNVHAMVAA